MLYLYTLIYTKSIVRHCILHHLMLRGLLIDFVHASYDYQTNNDTGSPFDLLKTVASTQLDLHPPREYFSGKVGMQTCG